MPKTKQHYGAGPPLKDICICGCPRTEHDRGYLQCLNCGPVECPRYIWTPKKRNKKTP